jgi:hypothetical protein
MSGRKLESRARSSARHGGTWEDVHVYADCRPHLFRKRHAIASQRVHGSVDHHSLYGDLPENLARLPREI